MNETPAMHEVNMSIARALIDSCVQECEGEQCFNVDTFLNSLEHAVDVQHESRLGGFVLNAAEVARYLWCSICLESGDDPGGTTFHGMPTLA